MMEQYIVFGAGGHAKIVLDILELNKKTIAGLVDPCLNSSCMGYSVLGTDDCVDEMKEKGILYAAMGIGQVGETGIRNHVYRRAKYSGMIFPVISHPSSVIAASAALGMGTVCAAMSVVNSESVIGELCIINTASVVEHEVVIGSGAHVAPHATILGGARIGDNTFVGAGSVVLQGVTVGKDCIIGAGTVILEDVPDNSIVVGTPGRIIKKR